MKSIKMALLGGAALAVTAAGAQADDLEALKAQIEALNARVAAMEAAPAVPAGYQLLSVSEGELRETPGLEMSRRDRQFYGNKGNVISILPTADAPAGAQINWNGAVRAALVYKNTDFDVTVTEFDSDEVTQFSNIAEISDNVDDLDVFARGELRVVASTDTAVGEVGVEMRVRSYYDGVGNDSDVELDVAWGYWAMTPELTFGGGYTGSLSNVNFGFDDACSCNYIDTLSLNPGDTSQLRLTYASGPFSMAVALEDASTSGFDAFYLNTDTAGDWFDSQTTFDLDDATDDRLGVAGEIKYTGDMFSAELSGMWRDIDEDAYDDQSFSDGGLLLDGLAVDEFLPDSWWQIGGGIGFGLADFATIHLAGAIGEGPTVTIDDDYYNAELYLPWNNQFWAVSALAILGVSDEVSIEIGGGYRHRDYDDVDWTTEGGEDYSFGADSDYWVVGGGIYYTPVDQLTVGVEASYSVFELEAERSGTGSAGGGDWEFEENDYLVDAEANQMIVDFVTTWRF
jgi:hypothetical protein